MTPGITDTITRDRFRSWAGKLKPHAATPVLAVAVGHGHHEGEVHVICVEDMSKEQIKLFLAHALATLEAEGGAA